MVLPSGTEVPPLPYLAVVAVGVVAVAAALVRARPRADGRLVVGLAPWMATGAALYVAHQLDTVPESLAPLTGSPTVYASTAIVAGAVWLAALRSDVDPARVLGAVGTAAALLAAAGVLWTGAERGTLRPVPSALAAAGGTLVAAGAWVALARVRPSATDATGLAGALVVLAHALDGVSTAVGVEFLDVVERTPLSRLVIEAGDALPLGGGWVFAAVKVALATGVVVLFADYVREDPSEANLLLALVAAVGLGPAVHNLLLFAVTGG
jgi:uncharacterized membrane protein